MTPEHDPTSPRGDESSSEELGRLLERLAEAPAEDRPAIFRGVEQPEGLLQRLGDEAERLASVELARSIAGSAALVTVADELGSNRVRARARRAQVHALAYGGRLEDALDAGRAARAVAESGGESIEAARAELAVMHPLCKLGRTNEAIDRGRAARDALHAAGAPALAARADINLANLEQARGAPVRALAHLDAARPALIDDASLVGPVESARGEALLRLDRFVEAEAAFQAASDALRSASAPFAAAVVEGNLADLCARQSRLQESLSHFELARRHLERDGAQGHLARLQIEQADAMEALGLPDEALAAYDDALPVAARLGLAAESARGLLGRARALLALRRVAQAIPTLDRAAEAVRVVGDDGAAARVDILRGEALLEEGRAEEASRILESVRERLEDRPLLRAATDFHRARIALDAGDLERADALLDPALRSMEQLDVPTLRADLLHLRGRIARRRGDGDLAVDALRAAVADVERVRASFRADRLRAAFLGDRVTLYEDLVEALLERGGPDATRVAYDVVEQAKSRSLLELVRGAVENAAAGLVDRDDPDVRALARDIARLQADLNALYARLEGDSEADRRRLADGAWHEQVRRQEQALTRLEGRLVATAPGRCAVGAATTAEHVQEALPRDVALLEYFTSGDELMAWIVTRETLQLRRAVASAGAVSDQVARMRFQIGRALRPGALDGPRRRQLHEGMRQTLEALHESIMAPVRASIPEVERLVVVPHGALHLVPFHALRGPDGDLVDRYELSTAPSAGLYVHARGQDARESRRSVVVGVGDHAAPEIDVEAQRLATRLPGSTALLGREATVERVAEAVGDADLVHLACHGRFSAVAPLSSGVRLADGWMTVRDISRLRLDAALVILSGCETGMSLITHGDELLGLLRGFLGAGARSVIASLWTTSDRSTAEFMQRFHDAYGYGRDTVSRRPAAALREAQRALRETWPHPVHWAPFIATGAS